MKKKPAPAEIPVVSPEIMELAKRSTSIPGDKLRRPSAARCSVCTAECSTTSSDQLCWVCRRLKISAWRDTDIQMNAQE